MSFFNLFKTVPDFQIIGKNCILIPLRRKDLPSVKAWFRDRELTKYAFGVNADGITLDRISNDYLRNIFSTSTEILGIWTNEPEPVLCGFINYSAKKSRDFTARIGILIGDEKNRSKGLGTEAMNIALLYLFDRIGLDRVDLDTATFNSRAKKCFEKCGFRMLRQVTDVDYISGKKIDKFLMEIYSEDFFETLYERIAEMPIFTGNIPCSRHIAVEEGRY